MSQTDVCVIQVHDHKMTTSFIFIFKVFTCCCSTKLDFTIQTKSYYFTIICSKLRKWPITVRTSLFSNLVSIIFCRKWNKGNYSLRIILTPQCSHSCNHSFLGWTFCCRLIWLQIRHLKPACIERLPLLHREKKDYEGHSVWYSWGRWGEGRYEPNETTATTCANKQYFAFLLMWILTLSLY